MRATGKGLYEGESSLPEAEERLGLLGRRARVAIRKGYVPGKGSPPPKPPSARVTVTEKLDDLERLEKLSEPDWDSVIIPRQSLRALIRIARETDVEHSHHDKCRPVCSSCAALNSLVRT